MLEWLSFSELSSLLQVIAIDLVLAGDNAIVVGMAAASLHGAERRKAILIGIGAATVLRIVFALFTVQLLQIVGLLFTGSLLLLWVSWKLWREIKQQSRERQAEGEAALEDKADAAKAAPKTFGQAVSQIIIADVSMSLDNVLAVAGAAREHTWVLVIGLALSVALMGVAASFIARLLNRHHWIAYVGLLVIVYVALAMMWEGSHELLAVFEARAA